MSARRSRRTVAQNRKIHGLLSELRKVSGLSREDCEALKGRLCMEISNQPRSSRLTEGQAGVLIAKLAEELPRKEARPRAGRAVGTRKDHTLERSQDHRPEMVTPGEQELIASLYEQLGFDRTQQMSFCSRNCGGRKWPQSRADAERLITALTKMVLRRWPWTTCRDLALELQGHEHLDAWQRGFVDDLVEQFATAPLGSDVMTTHKLKKLLEARARCL